MKWTQKNLQVVRFLKKEPLEVPECELPGLNMVQEQLKDSEILELKTVLAHDDPSKAL